MTDDEGATARTVVELVPAFRYAPSPDQKSSGCSSTSGTAPFTMGLLVVLLRRKRARATSV
ncbi:MYXO-CTERM sorting domain-containing protein [Myxococcus sp. Y35]|uniref:MYXO-CTERM sorting domain-containing protein n=1 Tax=Pseudomyxococcus flavus TaxID=3115648 RepID=UPI003CEC0B99